MTIQTNAVVPSSTAVDLEFDLDVSIVESGPVVAELMRDTSDNCERADCAHERPASQVEGVTDEFAERQPPP